MSAFRANLRIVSDGPRQRERRDDRVDAAAVGQARVDHRRGLVDAPADLRDDPVDDPQQVGVVEERGLGLLDPAVRARRTPGRTPLTITSVTLGSLQERLERAVAEDVVGDLALEVGAVARAERSLLGVQLVGDDRRARGAPARRCPRGSGRRCRAGRCTSGGSSSSARRADRGTRARTVVRSTRSRSASIELSLPRESPLRSIALIAGPAGGSDAGSHGVLTRSTRASPGRPTAAAGSARVRTGCSRRRARREARG